MGIRDAVNHLLVHGNTRATRKSIQALERRDRTVVPDDELDALADDWAERLAAGPPLALSQSKRMLNNAFSYGLSEAMEVEAAAQSINISSEDCREGMVAFFKKRPPVFKGR